MQWAVILVCLPRPVTSTLGRVVGDRDWTKSTRRDGGLSPVDKVCPHLQRVYYEGRRAVELSRSKRLPEVKRCQVDAVGDHVETNFRPAPRAASTLTR